MVQKVEIRKAMRARRRQLSAAQRDDAAIGLLEQCVRTPLFKRSRRIGFYIASDGEIDPAPLLHRAWDLGKQCFLPVLHGPAFNRLWFAPYAPHDALFLNRFDIPEPAGTLSDFANIFTLDLVLVPLVAFDNNGNRLGMGGGYYDRTFAYLKHRRFWRKPNLWGVAYEFQQVAALNGNHWDVPMRVIATESRVIEI